MCSVQALFFPVITVHLDMLEKFLMSFLKEDDPNHTECHQDEAPSHFSRYFFGQKFPRKWLGRGGLIPWSPFYPVRTPLDFYFWGIRGGMFEAFTLTPQPDTSNIRCRIVTRSNVTCRGVLAEVQGF